MSNWHSIGSQILSKVCFVNSAGLALYWSSIGKDLKSIFLDWFFSANRNLIPNWQGIGNELSSIGKGFACRYHGQSNQSKSNPPILLQSEKGPIIKIGRICSELGIGNRKKWMNLPTGFCLPKWKQQHQVQTVNSVC